VVSRHFHSLNVSLWEDFLLVGKFSVNNTKFVAKSLPFWENLRAKLKFLTPIIVSVGNLQPPVGKLLLLALPAADWCEQIGSRGRIVSQKQLAMHCLIVLRTATQYTMLCVQWHYAHTQVGRHLSIMGLNQDPLCSYCSVAEESASHFLCHCDYFATLRMSIWGKPDLYPADIDTATVGDIARFRIKKSRRFSLSIQPWLEP